MSWRGRRIANEVLSPLGRGIAMEFAGLPSLDLATLTDHLRTASAPAFYAKLAARIDSFPDRSVWINLSVSQVEDRLRKLDQRRRAGETLPLYAVPFAVKDNIDVAGVATTAGCPNFAYVPEVDAPVVKRLCDAGAIPVGKTNLDQFATGLCGDRSPYGACRNVFASDYISGGSSSGSAIAVAAGLVSFALGTDTAGSGRVPAGCSNIVGLKPTPGLLSTEGVVPACRSLDCVSVMALTVADAWQVACIARDIARPPALSDSPTSFAVPRAADLEFFGDQSQETLFRQATERLERMGLTRVEIDFTPFQDVAALLYEGPWVAERLAGLESFLKSQRDAVYPVTRDLIEDATRYRAVDVFIALDRLEDLRFKCLAAFDAAQVLVVPTMPTIPKLADVQNDSRGWSRRLGRYTNFVNLLHMAALALPSGFTPKGLPGGITVIGPSGSDRRLASLGKAWQSQTNLPLGVTKAHLPEPTPPPLPSGPPVSEGHVRVSVAGAHLKGHPLHGDLLKFGARFVRACQTASRYSFHAFTHLNPPRPGLLLDESRGGAIKVEIYDLPFEGFGKLVASVAPPLSIGTVELEDGEKVKGFLCESWAARSARDISGFGGWAAFQGALRDAKNR
jgi:allophanate hydrolase